MAVQAIQLGSDRMRHGAVEVVEVGHRLLPRHRIDSGIVVVQARGFDSPAVVGRGTVTGHDRMHGTGMKVLETDLATVAQRMEQVTLLETGVGPGTMVQGKRRVVDRGLVRVLGRMRGTVGVEGPETLLWVDTALAALETLLCDTVVAVVVLGILLSAGTGIVLEVQENVLERKNHVWRAVQERWSESRVTVKAPCRRRGTAVEEAQETLLEAGIVVVEELVTRPSVVLARLPLTVAGMNGYARFVSTAAVQETRLSKRESGMPALVDGSLCGHESRAC